MTDKEEPKLIRVENYQKSKDVTRFDFMLQKSIVSLSSVVYDQRERIFNETVEFK